MDRNKLKLGIDAGHGLGNSRPGRWDPGAVGGGMAEADVTLQWALTGKYVGIHVFGLRSDQIVLTRADASDVVPVSARDDMLVGAGCTHAISVHCNASSNPLAKGTATYYPEIRAGRGGRDDMEWAKKVQSAAVRAIGRGDRGIHAEDKSQHPRLAIFGLASQISTCLLETAFITNSGDRHKLGHRDVRVWFWTGLYRELGLLERR